jgi:protein TonB
MKEIPMLSRTRILAAIAAPCSLVSAAVLAAMWLFPFVAPPVSEAQTAPDSAGITVRAGAPLLHRAPVHMPAGASATGTVAVEASLDAQGNVTDARVLSGPQELRKEALASVLQWHYQPGPASAAISIQFDASKTTEVPAVALAQRDSVTVTAPRVAPPPHPPAGAATFPATLKAIQFQGLNSDAEQLLRSRLPFHEGDTISQADITNLRSALQAVDSHLSYTFVLRRSPGGTEELTLQVRVAAESAPAEGVVKQSPAVQNAKVIQSPAPVYPNIAKQARIQCDVTLAATIAADGTVQSLQVVSSTSPLLTPAAMDAVKHWIYQPTILNGQPVAVSTTVDVSFRLPE